VATPSATETLNTALSAGLTTLSRPITTAREPVFATRSVQTSFSYGQWDKNERAAYAAVSKPERLREGGGGGLVGSAN
jgi:hypothetical protein